MNTLRLKWAVIAVLLILLRSVVGSTNAMGQEMPDGALSGIFSISNGQFVNFSQGNLQYIGSEGWFYYDDGSLQSAIGFNTEETSFEWANMYPASLVAPYAGSMMTQVSFICYDAWNYHQSGIYTIKIYLGGDEAPETLVHTQNYEFDGIFTGDWVVVDLTTPVALDGSQNLWIALYNDAVEGHLRYPASYGCRRIMR